MTTMRRKLEKQQKLARFEKRILSGLTNQHELGVAFGISLDTVRRWMREIEQQWRDRASSELEDMRRKRIHQFEYIGCLAMDGYQRSRMDSEEFTISQKRCRECNGEGQLEEKPGEWETCKECGGHGKLSEEVTKVKGQAGDPAFLRVAKEAFLEAGKLEGVVANPMGIGKIISESRGVGGEIEERVEEMYIQADSDLIIRAKAMLEQLRGQISNGEARVIDQSEIDAPPDEEDQEDE